MRSLLCQIFLIVGGFVLLLKGDNATALVPLVGSVVIMALRAK